MINTILVIFVILVLCLLWYKVRTFLARKVRRAENRGQPRAAYVRKVKKLKFHGPKNNRMLIRNIRH